MFRFRFPHQMLILTLDPINLLSVSFTQHLADLLQLALLLCIIFLQLFVLFLQLRQLRLNTHQLTIAIDQIEHILLIIANLCQTVS